MNVWLWVWLMFCSKLSKVVKSLLSEPVLPCEHFLQTLWTSSYSSNWHIPETLLQPSLKISVQSSNMYSIHHRLDLASRFSGS